MAFYTSIKKVVNVTEGGGPFTALRPNTLFSFVDDHLRGLEFITAVSQQKKEEQVTTGGVKYMFYRGKRISSH